MKFVIYLSIVLLLISCGGVSKKNTKYDSHKLQKQRADAAFNELDIEAEKENPEDLVLDEKPLEINKKSDEVSNKKRPVNEIKKDNIKTEKRPAIVAEKKRPVNISTKERPLSKTKYPLKNGYPVWFYNPDYDGYLGAVGIASKQAGKSFYQQQKLAKMLAEAELAKKIKVMVNTELNLKQTKIESGVMNYYRSRLETFSKHRAEEFLSNVVIKDQWLNPKTHELYVWLVLEK
jgi:hypothetical protein